MIDEKNDLMNNIGSDGDKKLRKYLFLGASVFILFVIVVVVSKFLFQSKTDDTKVILPTEIKQDQDKIKKDEQNNLFKDIPVDSDTVVLNKGKFEKPEQTDENNKKGVVKKENKESKVVYKDKVVEEDSKKVINKKEVVKKENKESEFIGENSYYIQVAAVIRREVSKKFLNLIKKNGFEYKIVNINIKGKNIKRVLIGPYKNYSDAKKALIDVKKTISSSAFIKRLK